jgi:hypothetical protein
MNNNQFISGAANRTRACDPVITNEVLTQHSLLPRMTPQIATGKSPGLKVVYHNEFIFENCAQGRDRTTDTAIFSPNVVDAGRAQGRMLGNPSVTVTSSPKSPPSARRGDEITGATQTEQAGCS